MDAISSLTELEMLSIEKANEVDKSGLQNLATLGELRTLWLYDCDKIDDDALALVAALTDLENLQLSLDTVTDTGVAKLKALTNLTTLGGLKFCENVTDAMIKELETALPNAQVS